MQIKSSRDSFFMKSIVGVTTLMLAIILCLVGFSLLDKKEVFKEIDKKLSKDIEEVELVLTTKAYEKLNNKRKEALDVGVLLSGDEDLVKGKIKYQGKEYKVKARLKGDWTDHLKDDKWSFRIKVEGNESIMGMRKFSLQHPRTRNFAGEWLFQEVIKDYDVLGLQYKFVQFWLKTDGGQRKDLGTYAIEEAFDKQLFERQKRRAGLILKIDEGLMWEERAEFLKFGGKGKDLAFIDHTHYTDFNVVPFAEKRILKDAVLREQFLVGRDLLRSYVLRERNASEVFDVEKLASYNVICNMFGSAHAMIPHNWRLYYNPITSRLEPIGFDANGLEKLYYMGIFQWADKDLEYLKIFAEKVEGAVENEWYKELQNYSGMNAKVALLKAEYPEFVWDESIFKHNLAILKSAVLPEKSLNVFLEGIEDGKAIFSVENFGKMPVELLSLQHESNRSFGSLIEPEILLPKERKIVAFQLDKNYEKLFVNKKKKKTQFDLFNDIYKIRIGWKTYGTTIERSAMVNAWKENETDIANSLYERRAPKEVSKRPFLEIDETKKTITCKPGRWKVEKWILIPSGYTFIIGAGCHLDFFASGTQIISYSPVKFIGTKENPITFTSKSKKGAGIFVAGTQDTSIVKHCLFDNLSNPRVSNWGLSGAVNFYDAPVRISETSFKNNRSEDALNIINTWFEMDKVAFTNTQSDAFDGDFVEGTISNSTFLNLGNDAIDVSGSNITVQKTVIMKAGDKGLSAGENSKMIAEDVLVQESEVAIASKDLSKMTANQLVLRNNKLGFTAFQKKPEFGPCQIEATNVLLENNELNHLIERNSSLILNGQLMPVSDGVKERMYGAEFGKSSK